MPFEFEKLELAGAVLIKPRVFPDARGFFVEGYKKSDFAAAGIAAEFVQDNHSKSDKGVLRGLHYQKAPHAQAKLVRCGRGRIYDVAVDLRPRSKTYGKSFGIELSEANGLMLYIPEGFAHGFCAITDGVEVLYKCSGEYAPGHEGGVIWNDPKLKIKWPVKNPIISEKDLVWPQLDARRK